MVALDRVATASFGLVLAMTAHVAGWPFVRGGTQHLADALAAELRSLGGEIVTGHPVTTLDDLPPARAILFDTSPRAMLEIAGPRLQGRYRRRLAGLRYGPGVVKVDWALDGPIPWRAEAANRAGTVHVGGRLAEIEAAEAEVAAGGHPERPFVLVVQASRFDPTRAPEGKHTGWAYCHVPNGSTVDMSGRIEAQIERFAPGFRERILARSVRLPADLERENPNYVGGDINVGIEDVRQLFTRLTRPARPTATTTRPYPRLWRDRQRRHARLHPRHDRGLKFSNVGGYPITVSLGLNPNYNVVTKADSTLTIGAKAASVTADAKSKTYGDDNPALSAVPGGTVNGDTLNYTLDTTAAEVLECRQLSRSRYARLQPELQRDQDRQHADRRARRQPRSQRMPRARPTAMTTRPCLRQWAARSTATCSTTRSTRRP